MSELELTRAEQINTHHHACEAAVGIALKHALMCGALLEEQKAVVKHGGWLGWLEENFDGSVRTAQVYMRLSRNREAVEAAEAAKNADSAHLSIDGALRALDPPREPSREPSPAEDGVDLDEARREIRRHTRLHREAYAGMERKCVQAQIHVDAFMEVYEGQWDEYGPEERSRADEIRAEMEELERHVRAEMDAARHLFGTSPL